MSVCNACVKGRGWERWMELILADVMFIHDAM